MSMQKENSVRRLIVCITLKIDLCTIHIYIFCFSNSLRKYLTAGNYTPERIYKQTWSFDQANGNNVSV